MRGQAIFREDGSIELPEQGNYTGAAKIRLNADFEIADAGLYTCTVRMARPSAFIGSSQYFIDDTEVGFLTMSATPTNHSFAKQLEAGDHSFMVQPNLTTGWFYSLSVFRASIFSP